jgi:hypothetical protein
MVPLPWKFSPVVFFDAPSQWSWSRALCWPNGADLAPDAMYDEIKGGTRAAR